VEKKVYYAPAQEKAFRQIASENRGAVLHKFWQKLASVKQFYFQAKIKGQEEKAYMGRGKGEVHIAEGDGLLIFTEKGVWDKKAGEEDGPMHFSNVFRWTIDRGRLLVSLEHLRHGSDRPVFLFHLAPSGSSSLTSVDSHLCGEDVYFGQIYFDRHTLRLTFRAIGPKKNQETTYYYH
jgi:hypothetical protein